MNESFNQLRKWSEFFLFDESEFLHKIDEVFEGSVEMGLLLKTDDFGEVNVINVSVDSK